jgi:class 3 adenylate cyclase
MSQVFKVALAADGGQILMSGDTRAEIVGNAFAMRAEIRSLGEHRLSGN